MNPFYTYLVLLLLTPFNALLAQSNNPISFELVNTMGNDFVFIDDDPSSPGQEMILTLQNNTSNTITFDKGNGQPVGKNNYHFKLEIDNPKFQYFTRNTLQHIQLMTSSRGIYEMSVDLSNTASQIFYFLIKKTASYKLAADSRTFIRLVGFKARSTAGPMSEVALTLVYQNAEALSGSFQNRLHIKQPDGLEQIPLQVGILGANKVLNNGYANDLLIGLENIAASNLSSNTYGHIPITKDSSSIRIRFQLEPHVHAPWKYPWSLTTEAKFKKMPLPTVQLNGGGTDLWKIEFSKDTLSWVFRAQKDGSLAPGDLLQINISNLISSMPDGESQIFVHYHHFSGYYDNTYNLPVLKGPITEEGINGVGIGRLPIIPPLTLNSGLYAKAGKPVSDAVGYSMHGKLGDGMYSTKDGEVALYLNKKERLVIDKKLFAIKKDGVTQLYIDSTDNTVISNSLHVESGIISKDKIMAKKGFAFKHSNGKIAGLFKGKKSGISLYTQSKERVQIDRGGIKLLDGGISISGGGTYYAKSGAPGKGNKNKTGYAFALPGSNDTGLFSLEDGSIALYVDGKAKMTIDKNQNITYAQAQAESGSSAHGGTIKVPYGGVKDWAILVNGKDFNCNDGNITDNSLIHLEAYVTEKDSSSWTVTCQIYYAGWITHPGKKYPKTCNCDVDYILVKN